MNFDTTNQNILFEGLFSKLLRQLGVWDGVRSAVVLERLKLQGFPHYPLFKEAGSRSGVRLTATKAS
jgi:hypothetical protein